MILATWFKKNLKETLVAKVYADKNKTRGVNVDDKDIAQKIYNQYLEAFKKGAYEYIKEDYDPATQQIIPRKYFSGGVVGINEAMLVTEDNLPAAHKRELFDGDSAMIQIGLTDFGKGFDPAEVARVEREAVGVSATDSSDAAMVSQRYSVNEIQAYLLELLQWDQGLSKEERAEDHDLEYLSKLLLLQIFLEAKGSVSTESFNLNKRFQGKDDPNKTFLSNIRKSLEELDPTTLIPLDEFENSLSSSSHAEVLGKYWESVKLRLGSIRAQQNVRDILFTDLRDRLKGLESAPGYDVKTIDEFNGVAIGLWGRVLLAKLDHRKIAMIKRLGGNDDFMKALFSISSADGRMPRLAVGMDSLIEKVVMNADLKFNTQDMREKLNNGLLQLIDSGKRVITNFTAVFDDWYYLSPDAAMTGEGLTRRGLLEKALAATIAGELLCATGCAVMRRGAIDYDDILQGEKIPTELDFTINRVLQKVYGRSLLTMVVSDSAIPREKHLEVYERKMRVLVALWADVTNDGYPLTQTHETQFEQILRELTRVASSIGFENPITTPFWDDFTFNQIAGQMLRFGLDFYRDQELSDTIQRMTNFFTTVKDGIVLPAIIVWQTMFSLKVVNYISSSTTFYPDTFVPYNFKNGRMTAIPLPEQNPYSDNAAKDTQKRWEKIRDLWKEEPEEGVRRKFISGNEIAQQKARIFYLNALGKYFIDGMPGYLESKNLQVPIPFFVDITFEELRGVMLKILADGNIELDLPEVKRQNKMILRPFNREGAETTSAWRKPITQWITAAQRVSRDSLLDEIPVGDLVFKRNVSDERPAYGHYKIFSWGDYSEELEGYHIYYTKNFTSPLVQVKGKPIISFTIMETPDQKTANFIDTVFLLPIEEVIKSLDQAAKKGDVETFKKIFQSIMDQAMLSEKSTAPAAQPQTASPDRSSSDKAMTGEATNDDNVNTQAKKTVSMLHNFRLEIPVVERFMNAIIDSLDILRREKNYPSLVSMQIRKLGFDTGKDRIVNQMFDLAEAIFYKDKGQGIIRDFEERTEMIDSVELYLNRELSERMIQLQREIAEIAEIAADVSKDDAALVNTAQPDKLGGIDLNADLLDLQIKRDGNGVPLPLPQQPIEKMNIEGFLPFIINVKPIDLPLFLGEEAVVTPSENHG